MVKNSVNRHFYSRLMQFIDGSGKIFPIAVTGIDRKKAIRIITPTVGPPFPFLNLAAAAGRSYRHQFNIINPEAFEIVQGP